jgi:hypothetical protein
MQHLPIVLAEVATKENQSMAIQYGQLITSKILV